MELQRSNQPLFIFELANNHMGNVDHGLLIIRKMKMASEGYPFHFAVKLQFRNLDTYIHPAYVNRTDLKYVKRFSETRLSYNEFKKLRDGMETAGFTAVCTPFDEKSVDLIEELNFDIIKIASCSFTDWPLLERIALTKKSIIASVAGSSLEEIDRVVSFFEHREKDFALLHCVGEYPTQDLDLNLKQIALLHERHPKVRIGFSTHENPDNTDSVKVAIGCGATIFEKHVGVPTDSYPLNSYSANPEQVKKWLDAAKLAFELCGVSDRRMEFKQSEITSLRSLRRGVYANRLIRANEQIAAQDTFLAIPVQENQITANDQSKYTEFYATEDIQPNAPLLNSNTRQSNARELVGGIVQRVKEILNKSNVPIPPKVDLEISHHYGIERFDQSGLVMITIVNREYCKKMIIMLPGQSHPEQLHKQKEETFHILWGDVWIMLDGKEKLCKAGEVVVIERGVKHSFHSDRGVVIEEISSTHYVNDSFYSDAAIMKNKSRKTLLTYWLE